VLALLTVLVMSVLFVSLASAHGAFGAARNDDWSYFRVAFDFADDQRFHVDGWIQTMLVGHTVLAWPIVELFGESIRALQLLGVTAGAVGTVCAYALVRRFLTPAPAVLACLTLLWGPVYGSVAVSYMTDTTAFATQALTLLVGVRALETRSSTRSRWLLVAAAGLGLLAFSIREYAVVAFPAVLVVGFLRSRRDTEARARLVPVAVGFASAALFLFAWRRSLPNTISPSLDLRPGIGDLRQLMRFALTLGLFVSPAAFAISPIRALSRSWASNRVLTASALGAGIVCVLGSNGTLLGNYVTAAGSYQNTTVVRTSPSVIPGLMFSLARGLGAYALCIALLVLVRAIADAVPVVRSGRALPAFSRHADAHPGLAVVALFSGSISAVSLLVIAATTGTFFDRYLIPLVPFLAALLILGGRTYQVLWRSPARVAATGLAVFAVLGFVYVDAAATVDGAKWRAAKQLVEAGFRPATIDAGYEWFGLHQSDDVVPDWEDRPGALATRLFSPRPVCATVVLHGTERGARSTANGETVLLRSDEHTLLGRKVIVMAIRGPDDCSPQENGRT
jgi:4-amino-4-deoxy-L-arabinose transferase-like glycosyltransferase